MGAQREICQQIIEQEGDYVISLKGSQGTLHDDVMTYFNDKKILEKSLVSEENDKGHGRIEQRIAYSLDDIKRLQDAHEWPGLNSIGMVTIRFPLYRQEMIWARYGVMIPRNSSCNWLMKTAELCEPLWLLLGEHIRLGNYTQADETTLQVLATAKAVSNRKKHYMWLYRGGAPNQIATVFDYQMTRSGQHARDFLSGFKGYLQTDGYNGYDWVDEDPDIVHLACMAHARRPFAELVKIAKKTGKAHQAIAYIKKLYRVEDMARVESLSPQARYELRLKESKPLLDSIRVWLENSLPGTPAQSKLGKAIRYMLQR